MSQGEKLLRQQYIESLQSEIQYQLTKIKPIEMEEQGEKNKLDGLVTENLLQKESINTQVYQLRLIQNTLEKAQIGRGDTSLISGKGGLESETGSGIGSGAQSVGASTIMPNRIRDLARGQRKQVSSEDFQKKYEEYEFLLDAFKEQIESDFDKDLIKKQRKEKIDLVSSKTLNSKK